MAFLPTNAAQVQAFAGALYGIQVGSTTMAQVNADIAAVGGLNSALNAYYTASFGSQTTSAVAASFVANLGLTGAAATEGTAYVKAQLDATAAGSRGVVINNILNLFAGLSNDATFGAAATAWNAKVAAAVVNTSAADVAFGTSTSATGTTFTLTEGANDIAGGAGNDTITGVIGTSSTYSVGDNINGGAGTDTVRILSSGGSVGVVSLANVENVTVRTLVASGAAVTEIDASDWVGVSVLSNASSLAASELQFSGLATTTQVVLHGNTDISGNFANSTTADISIGAVNAGTFAGVTTYGVTAVTANATANIVVDGAAAGTISGVTINLSGNNLLRVDAGVTADSFTITGNGSAVLLTDNRIATADASAFTGNLDLELQGASDTVVKGGAGNDTLRLGTTFSNNDSFDGGAGTDTVRATVAGFNRNLNTTNVENATLTFTEAAGGDVNASGSTVTSFTFVAGTAGNAASVSQIANGATFTLNDDDLGNVTLDYTSGAATTTLNIGSVSGAVGIDTLAITDVAAVTINAVGVSGTVGGSIGTASFDSALKSLLISTSGGEADLTIGTDNADMQLGGATSLTVTSNGSAAITFNTVDLAGSQLTTVNVFANNTDAADVTLGDVSGSAITAVNLTAASGADITVGTLDLGNNTTATLQDIALTIVQGQTSNVTVGNITYSAQGTLTLNVTQNGTSIADIGTITLDRIAGVTADSPAANLTIAETTVAGSGEVAINAIKLEAAGTGAQLTFGAITVTKDGGFSAGAVSASAAVNVDISNIAVTVGGSASANFAGFVGFNNGAIGSLSVNVSDAGSANFGAMSASAIGAATIVAASGAGVDVGAIFATTGGSTTGGAVGAIEISGVDGADVTYSTIAASAVGAISVSGALDVTFGTITAARIGEVNSQNQGASGSFTIDLSGVVAAAEVKLGVATNTVISGLGNDVITLTGGRTAVAGNDVIRYTTATQGTDSIINFIAGAAASGGDQLELDVSEFGSGIINSDGSGLVDASTMVFGTASGAAVTLGASADIILFTTAYASTAALITDAKADITMATSTLVSGQMLAAWTDGTDTFISLINFEEGASATDGLATLASASAVTVTTLAVLQGVTPGALVAANFDIV